MVKNINNKDSSEIFARYFTSYAEILGKNFKVMKIKK